MEKIDQILESLYDRVIEPMEAKEQLRLEREDFLQRCGSCLNFAPFMAEAGFCKIAECNCLCKNPKAMIDMWNDKCEKWVANPNCL